MKQGRVAQTDARAGFALALVVLLLFAIAVAGATGYQIVHGEWGMAVQSSEGQTSLSLARAGLQRYIAEQVGVFADTVTYSLNGGDAVVAARKIADVDDYSSLYLLSAEGVYSDPSTTQSPARRTVYQYAVHKETPVDWLSAMTQSSGSLSVESGATITGNDISTTLDCPEGGGPAVVGIAAGADPVSFNPANISGSADSVLLGTHATVLDTLDLGWSTLMSPTFPVDFQDVWASAIPVDSFPVVRFNSNLIGYGWTSGKGVLIVNGSFQPQWGFTWDGIILTAHFNPMSGGFNFERQFIVRGAVFSGLDGLASATFFNSDGRIDYHRCNVIQSARALGHFRAIGNTWWESM